MTVAILLGAPRAGKGTQAPLLAASLGVPVLASGDLLRAEVASGSEIGREVDEVMRSGELVSDDLMVRLFLARLDQPDAATGAILDGFPRTRRQAEALDEALNASGRPVDLDRTIRTRWISPGRLSTLMQTASVMIPTRFNAPSIGCRRPAGPAYC